MTEPASNILEGGPAANEAGAKPTIVFSDADLVRRTREGDMQAYGTLVAKYQDRILNLLLRMTGRRADAEELAQETFLKALERIGQFRGKSQFYTWLFRIAANLAISHRRRGGRVKFRTLSGYDDFDQTQADILTAEVSRKRSPDPQSSALSGELRRRVLDALEELEEEFRLVVLLRDMEDMDYAGIAGILAVPVGTVKSRLHRARCMLKEKLADLMPG